MPACSSFFKCLCAPARLRARLARSMCDSGDLPAGALRKVILVIPILDSYRGLLLDHLVSTARQTLKQNGWDDSDRAPQAYGLADIRPSRHCFSGTRARVDVVRDMKSARTTTRAQVLASVNANGFSGAPVHLRACQRGLAGALFGLQECAGADIRCRKAH